MATCYDCIHCDACSEAGDSGFSSLKEDVRKCKHFKNKADVVEVPKWIDVNERLPKDNVRVLVSIKKASMVYTNIDTDRMEDGKWVRWRSLVTHWMPLPDEPIGF